MFFEKRLTEEKIFYQNPQTYVIRLGWQIAETPGSNNMVDYAENEMKTKGEITASRKWLPACSYISDTVHLLFKISQMQFGLYMINSNDHWNFFEIISAINNKYNFNWNVIPTEDFEFDQRLLDDKIRTPSLNHHLPSLK